MRIRMRVIKWIMDRLEEKKMWLIIRRRLRMDRMEMARSSLLSQTIVLRLKKNKMNPLVKSLRLKQIKMAMMMVVRNSIK